MSSSTRRTYAAQASVGPTSPTLVSRTWVWLGFAIVLEVCEVSRPVSGDDRLAGAGVTLHGEMLGGGPGDETVLVGLECAKDRVEAIRARLRNRLHHEITRPQAICGGGSRSGSGRSH